MNHPIRVVMVSHGYYPRLGGAERQLAALTSLLKDEGLDICVLTRRDTGLTAFERIRGIPVYRLPSSGTKGIASFTFTLTALWLLHRLRPDIIHAHGLLSPAATAIAARRLFGTSVAVKILRGGRSGLGDIDRLGQKFLGKYRLAEVCQQVDRFIAISQEIDMELAALDIPTTRRVLIPNGVDTTHFIPLPPERKRELRQTLNLPDVRIVIFTGRLSPEKRIHHLLTIWPVIRQTCPDALLLVLGTGPEMHKLRQAAGPGIQFAGGVDDVCPYLQAADLFVLPSVAEGLSNALLEAMATGLPAVVTDVGGAADVITHNHNGMLVPSGDVAALQDAVLTLLEDPARRAVWGSRSRECMKRCYALPMIAKRLRALYEQLANSPRRTGGDV